MNRNIISKSHLLIGRLTSIAFIAAAGLSLIAAGGAAQAQAKDAVPFTVSMMKGNALSYVPEVARQTGIWEKHGLAMNYVNVTNGPSFISSVQSGSADGGVTAFSLTLPAEAKGGKRMVAVAGDIGVASYAIAVRNELVDKVKGDWREVATALKGMRIGVPSLGGEVGFVMQGYLRAAGIDPAKDVTLLQSGAFSASAAALKRGDIDAYIGSSYAQLLGLEENGMGKIVLDLNKAAPFETWIQTAFFVSDSVVKERPQAVKRVQAALKETHAWIKKPENFPQTLKIANSIFPIGEQAMKDFIHRFEYEVDKPSVSANLDFFKNAGIIKQPVQFEDVVIAD